MSVAKSYKMERAVVGCTQFAFTSTAVTSKSHHSLRLNMDPNQADRASVRNRIVGMKMAGSSPTEIARTLAISKTTVYLWLKRFEEQGNVKTKKIPGAPKQTTAEENRKIIQEVRANPFTNSTDIARTLQLTVSPRTIRRRLHEAGLRNRAAATKDVLTATHKERRLQFAQQHIEEDLSFWGRVVFSDEKTFSSSTHGRARCWRFANTR